MDELLATKKKDRSDIRNLCAVIFEGGDPTQYPEYADIWCIEYALLFTIFFRIVDARHGNYLHYPFEGAVMNQPDKTMLTLDVIREEFRKRIAAK